MCYNSWLFSQTIASGHGKNLKGFGNLWPIIASATTQRVVEACWLGASRPSGEISEKDVVAFCGCYNAVVALNISATT